MSAESAPVAAASVDAAPAVVAAEPAAVAPAAAEPAPAAPPAIAAPAAALAAVEIVPAGTIVVHHLQDSRSQRILWLLEELSVPYVVKRYERKNGLAPPDLLAVHPLGKSPVISDGARVLAESGAIVDYLISKYGADKQFVPADEDQRLDVNYWSHAAEGSLMPPLVMKKVFGATKAAAPWLVRPVAGAIADKVNAGFIDPTLQKMFALVESTLDKNQKQGGQFLVGNHLTAADFQVVFPLEAAGSRANDMLGPLTQAYVARIHAREAYQRGLSKGGAYSYAKCS